MTSTEHRGPTTAVVALSVDGTRVVTGSDDGTLLVRSTVPADMSGDWTIREEGLSAVAISADGRRVVTGALTGQVRVWEIGSAVPTDVLSAVGTVRSLAVSEEGTRVVVASADGTMHVGHLGSAGYDDERWGHGGPVSAVSSSGDGTVVASGGLDGVVRLWDAESHERIGQADAEHADQVTALAFSSDGRRVISGGRDGTVRVRDVRTGRRAGEPLPGLQGAVTAVALSPDGRYAVVGGTDGVVHLHDTGGIAVSSRLGARETRIAAVSISTSGDVVSVDVQGSVRRAGTTFATPPGSPVTAMAVAGDGSVIVVGRADGLVRRHDPATGEPLLDGPIRGGPGEAGLLAVALSQDGNRLAMGDRNGMALVGDPATYELIGETFTRHTGPVDAIAITADGSRVVSGDEDGTTWVWEVADAEPVGEAFSVGEEPVVALGISADGDTVVVVDEAGAVVVGSPGPDHRRTRTLDVGTGVSAAGVSPDLSRLAVGRRDGSCELWDVASGRRIAAAAAHPTEVDRLAFTADGSRMVSASYDGTLRCWDGTVGLVIGPPVLASAPVVALAVVDDRHAAIGGTDGLVSVVGLPADLPPSLRSVDVVSDAAAVEDAFDWTEDVTTMAAMLVARTTVPPLSVALMGNWGSGKSTFMGLVQARVAELARLARELGSESAYVAHVHQVRFNAWHYSDDHLWVGFAEHLFRTLRDDEQTAASPDPGRRVTQEADLADTRARQAHLDRALAGIDELAVDRGWLGRLLQVRRSWLVVRAAGGAARRRLDRSLVLPAVLTVMALVLVVAVVVLADQFQGLVGRLGWLAPATVLAGAIRSAVSRTWAAVSASTGTLREQLIADRDRYAMAADGLERRLTEVDPARQLDELLREITTTERYAGFRGLTGRVHHDLQRLDDLLRRADTAHRPALRRIVLYVDDLDRCVSARVVEVLQAVNLLLTMPLFVVVVAVDPRWLLRALERHHGELLNARPTDEPGRPLDYLDKIFHVPFAVRPMREHAESYLRGLLPTVSEGPAPPGVGADRGGSDGSDRDPADPIAASGRMTVEETLGPRPGSRPPSTAVDTTGPGGPGVVEARSDESSGLVDPALDPGSAVSGARAVREGRVPGPTRPARGVDRASSPGDAADPTGSGRGENSPPPPAVVTGLELSPAEADFVPRLAAFIPTPRGVKKLANLYRLLRIGVPDRELPEFLGEHEQGGPYQAAVILLATLVASPGDARALLSALQTTPGGDTSDIIDRLRSVADDVPIAATVADLIAAARAGGVPVHGHPATYAHWATVVARYSFDTYDLFG